MGLSWHDEEYGRMVTEMEDYMESEYEFNTHDAHDLVTHFVNIMIDHGAVDPT